MFFLGLMLFKCYLYFQLPAQGAFEGGLNGRDQIIAAGLFQLALTRSTC